MKPIKHFIKKYNKKLFHNLKEISANDAFNMTKFGTTSSVEQRLESDISNINTLIRYKILDKKFSLIVEVDDFAILPDLVAYYKKMNYSVIMVDNSLDKRITETYLIIKWEKNERRNY